ncbi:MAG: hypothetical protein ACM3PY_08520 [Omnitrophica WOR_2 bacterium]
MDPVYVQGNQEQWRLLQLIGEGDAGEVYLVESLREKKKAILKRPQRSSFTADVLRQSSQISTEASILKALAGLRLQGGGVRLQIADLLDMSVPGNELTERFFIVIEKAPGIDLNRLVKTVRNGRQGEPPGKELLLFSEKIMLAGAIPPLLLLRIIYGCFLLFDAIHSRHVQWFNDEKFGILWNDIKIDHLFWDPLQNTLTVIDWGNGQFLEQDQVTQDRLYSPLHDYRQFYEVFAKFLAQHSPELLDELNWPVQVHPDAISENDLSELRERISQRLQKETNALMVSRQQETNLIASPDPDIVQLAELDEIQNLINTFGEMADYENSTDFLIRLATRLIRENRFKEFLETSPRLVQSPGIDTGKWDTLSRILQILLTDERINQQLIQSALLSGLEGDWTAALWNLYQITWQDNEPARWLELNSLVRQVTKEINPDIPTPFVAACRLLQVLEGQYNLLLYRVGLPSQAPGQKSIPELLPTLEARIGLLRNEVVKKWIESNPVPPGAGLGYDDVEAVIQDLAELVSGIGNNAGNSLTTLARSLSQPRAYAQIVLDAWQAKGFKTAQKGLHALLLWDPERRRIFRIDQLLQLAPIWLDEVRKGPDKGEKLQEYALRMEYQGRELRSQVSSAEWLENILDVFRQIRSGKRPGDLVSAGPKLVLDLPWLKKYERKAPSPIQSNGPSLKKFPKTNPEGSIIREIREGRFGPGTDFSLIDPLDTWVPEARGSSARVFQGFLRERSGSLKQAAVKIMRPDKVEYAVPLFWEEAQILLMMSDVPGVVRLVESGFLRLDETSQFPVEDPLSSARLLCGSILRYQADESERFAADLSSKAESGWLPYLAVEKKSAADNLISRCDEGYTHGRYLDVSTGIKIAIQICEILQIAHVRNIVYRDHKIIHYYWNQAHRRVSMIDWNVAKWHPAGLSEAEIQADLVQFGARALHHLFTGRTAPGALAVGPNRPDEIEMAPHSYSVAWTYDDRERLPEELCDILAQLLSGTYTSADQLREDLLMQAS